MSCVVSFRQNERLSFVVSSHFFMNCSSLCRVSTFLSPVPLLMNFLQCLLVRASFLASLALHPLFDWM